MCYDKNSLLFQLVAINLYQKRLLRDVSWNQLKSGNIETLYLSRTSADRLQESTFCYRTSMNINILLIYLLKVSLNCFMVLVFFYTPWNTSKDQRFSDVFRVHKKRLVPWSGLSGSFSLYLLILFITTAKLVTRWNCWFPLSNTHVEFTSYNVDKLISFFL